MPGMSLSEALLGGRAKTRASMQSRHLVRYKIYSHRFLRLHFLTKENLAETLSGLRKFELLKGC
jgi:hypothetical protein